MDKTTAQKAFTLVEIMIYVSVFFIVVSALGAFVFNIILGSIKTRTINEVRYNTRFALHHLVKEIRRADSINIGSSIFDSHPGVLSLENPTPGENPTVFSLSGDERLQVVYGTHSAQFLTSQEVRVTNLVFENLGIPGQTGNIRIHLTVSYKNPTSKGEYNWSQDSQITVNVRTIP